MIGKIAAAATLALTPVPGEQPYFKLPFPCGQVWSAGTYDGHWPNRNSLDMFHRTGATEGSPLLAPATGIVEYSGWWSPKSGWTLILDHGRGWKTYLLHLKEKALVAEGQKVMQGRHVAYVGGSGSHNGKAYVPHLHYTVMAEDVGVQAVFSGRPVTPPAVLTSRNCGSSWDGDAEADLLWARDEQVLAYPSLEGEGVKAGAGWGPAARLRFPDLNGDGVKDVVRLNDDGSGTAPEPRWNVKSRIADPARVLFADLDGDRADETVTVSPDGRLTAFKDDQPIVVGLGPDDPQRVRFTDLDGDGKDDVAFIDPNGDVRAYLNEGFTYPGNPLIVSNGHSEPARTRFADLDGNGRDELIVFHGDGDVESFWNKGNGQFEAEPEIILRGKTDYRRMFLV